ncbi:MAG: class I SAM-dependent methyltransferase [Desulfobacteraceae bacterium]|nr:class I SAM-dependent methyltransferase [Desulfobacteraceae bacterium]MBC2755683.1 class I SAM-dependent methyltransferase [Desulfobacteraceae bacterium]
MKDAYIKKFDSVYESNDSYYGFELRKEFTDYFKEKTVTGQTVLDLGCGEGRYSLFMAQKGCDTLAVDRSTAGIEKLKKMAETHRLPISAKVIDIEDFVFEENKFDIIIVATVLDHLCRELRYNTINGIKKALKPEGTLYVNVFTVSDPGYITRQNAVSEINSETISDTAECMEYYFDSNELKSLFYDFNILYYYEGIEPDLSHGRPHDHGWACLLARKPGGGF